MVSEMRIHYEGTAKLRKGFQAFLRGELEKSGPLRLRVNPVAGDTAVEACKDFERALTDHPKALNILLVDGEEPVTTDHPWDHLAQRQENRVAKPQRAKEHHAHLMVQIMESWFLADKKALEDYYGQGFRAARLPRTSKIEDIPKDTVLRALNEAAAECKKAGYHKTRNAPDLLEKIDPAKVRAASRWCERLFNTIEEVIESP